MTQAYLDAVRLLLAVAPVIFRKPTFALKGGTAINLFVRNMPKMLGICFFIQAGEYTGEPV
jgi:hypothetical protein